MKNKNKLNDLSKIITIIALLFGLRSINAQEVNLGADLVSRYVWRGIDFGNAPSIQPSLSFELTGFEIGAWGAYQVGRDANSEDADEIDLFLSYTHSLGEMDLSLILTDYYFPNSGIEFGNFNDWNNANGKGAHNLELGASISGGESFPVTLSAYLNVYNDPDNTVYFDLSYTTTMNETNLNFFIGATPGGTNQFYGTKNFNVINLGVTSTKNIRLNDSFSLPVFVSYILNPYTEKAHFVFGVSI